MLLKVAGSSWQSSTQQKKVPLSYQSRKDVAGKGEVWAPPFICCADIVDL